MSSPFTIWHYVDFILIATLFALAVFYTLKQKDLPQKSSYIATYSIAALVLLLLTNIAINQYTKKVVLLNVKDQRFLSTESIIFTGTVRNTGDYDVGEVEIEIEIFDKGLKKQGKLSFESSAFKDYFGKNNSEVHQPSFLFRRTVAKELKAGHSKHFAVSIDYPSYFQGYTDKQRVIVH